MNYTKAKLRWGNPIYGLEEYYPYTDKIFFEIIEESYEKEEVLKGIVNKFVDLYKEELVFQFPNILKHDIIVPIQFNNSKKFSKINYRICEELAKELDIQFVKDYFIDNEIDNVDIRDDYTKDKVDINININKNYEQKNCIFFDFCCSTGIIFNKIKNSLKNNDNTLFLCYGFRYDCTEVNYSYIENKEKLPKDINIINDNHEGFVVRIYGLFGYKDVKIDLRNNFSINIGENGFGKSIAMKIAILALKIYFGDGDIDKLKLTLAKYYFKKIEILKYGYYFRQEENKKNGFNVGDRIYHKTVKGYGIIKNIDDKHIDITFDIFGDRQISRQYEHKINHVIDHKIVPNNCYIRFNDITGKNFLSFNIKEKNAFDLSILENYKIEETNLLSIIKNQDNFNSDKFLNIETDEEFNIEFKIDDNFIKNNGIKCFTICKSIDYSECIPTIDKLYTFELSNEEINDLKKLNQEEYEALIRKSINKDNSIKLNFEELFIKYNINNLENIYDKISSEIGELNTNQSDYYSETFNFILFNCTKSKELICELPKNIEDGNYKTNDYFDYNPKINGIDDNLMYDNEIDDDYTKNISDAIERHYEEWQEEKEYYGGYSDSYDPEDGDGEDYFNPDDYDIYDEASYDDTDYSLKDDNLDDEYEDYLKDKQHDNNENKIDEGYRIFEYFKKQSINNIINNFNFLDEHESSDFESDPLWLFNEDKEVDEKIKVHEEFYKCFFEENININKILGSININRKINYREKIRIIDSIYKQKANDKIIYQNQIINELIQKIVSKNVYLLFGIFTLVDSDCINIINQIKKNLLYKKEFEINEIIALAAINNMIDSYINNLDPKFKLLEKLVNKYLFNKYAIFLDKNLVIIDKNNNYIPISLLSTGERNIIKLFLLCVFDKGKFFILDEPDVSMSVDWQSKLLPDLINYTKNKYLIITQSPLLVQKNGLAVYTKRFDFEKESLEEVSKEIIMYTIENNYNNSFEWEF